MLKLPESTALKIFEMYHQGSTVLEISRRLQVGRNCIQAHLRGEYHYSPKIQSRISDLIIAKSDSVHPVPTDFISLRQSRIMIPFTPSESGIYTIAKSRNFRTKLVGIRRVTKPEWVRRYVVKTYGHLPHGVAIRTRDIDMLLLDELPTEAKRDIVTFDVKRSRHRQKASMLYSVRDVCESANVRFEVPFQAYCNALDAIRLGADFVLLSPRLFLRSASSG